MKKLILCVAAMFLFAFLLGKILGSALSAGKSYAGPEAFAPAPKNEPDKDDVVILYHRPRIGETNHKPAFAPFTVKMKVTAYDPWDKECVGRWAKLNKKDPHRRKKWSKPGLAAANNLLPKGVRLRSKEFGELKVDDTGGAMRKSAENCVYHLDRRLQTHEEAEKHGVRWIEVEVLDPIPESPCLQIAATR